MRKNPSRVGTLPVLSAARYLPVSLCLLVAFSAGLVSCSDGQSRTLALSGGTTIRWCPAEPKIGDLVTLEAVGKGSAPAPSPGPVRDPSGSAIDPAATEFTGGSRASKKIRWSFRVTMPGSWTFDDGEKKQTLWNAATVAGKEKELKKFDGESLWHSSKPKAIPSAAVPTNANQGIAPTKFQGANP